MAALHARTYGEERDNANEKKGSRESKRERNRERESKCDQAKDPKKNERVRECHLERVRTQERAPERKGGDRKKDGRASCA